MQLTTLDWVIVAVSIAVSFAPAVWLARSAGSSSAEFFTSGRAAPWWLVGVSMVATTFSTDTPNLVTNMVREGGVAANWAWWAFLLTGMSTVYFFLPAPPRLWAAYGVLAIGGWLTLIIVGVMHRIGPRLVTAFLAERGGGLTMAQRGGQVLERRLALGAVGALAGGVAIVVAGTLAGSGAVVRGGSAVYLAGATLLAAQAARLVAMAARRVASPPRRPTSGP